MLRREPDYRVVGPPAPQHRGEASPDQEKPDVVDRDGGEDPYARTPGDVGDTRRYARVDVVTQISPQIVSGSVPSREFYINPNVKKPRHAREVTSDAPFRARYRSKWKSFPN